MAGAVLQSGEWIVCRPGCYECCIGPFPITLLDAARLRAGLAELEVSDPKRAARVHGRATAWVERMRREFPEDTCGKVLEHDHAAEDELCPALDPGTGECDLYSARPITCRTFGPAVRVSQGPSSVCELCYQGASDEEIAACAVDPDPEDVEGELLRGMEPGAQTRETMVAFALAGAS